MFPLFHFSVATTACIHCALSLFWFYSGARLYLETRQWRVASVILFSFVALGMMALGFHYLLTGIASFFHILR